MQGSVNSQITSVFRHPSPEGRGCREAAGEGYRKGISLPLTRPFGPPSPFRRGIRPKLLMNLASTTKVRRAVVNSVAAHRISRGILRYSKWDALLIGLSLLHPLVIFFVPSFPAVAIGLWWNSNTVSHNFIHLPFFRSNRWNRAYSCFLSLLLGFPQTLWRDRHLAHHGGHPTILRFTPAIAFELGAVLLLWGFLFFAAPGFFLFAYLPGYAIGLGLCRLQGHFEHAGGTTSHYGLLYNVSFFNDGYHVEHHRLPGEHWTRLPGYMRSGARTSSWPAIFRWLERINIELLERIALRSRFLQQFLLTTHERALRDLLPAVHAVRKIKIIGGGMFPRTAILLQKLIPDATITIMDASADSIKIAKSFLPCEGAGIEFEVRLFDPHDFTGDEDVDLIVIPLAFIGDRKAVYSNPPSRVVLVHDWIWSRQGRGAVISALLLKRINLVLRRD
jgi:hypothetical protein